MRIFLGDAAPQPASDETEELRQRAQSDDEVEATRAQIELTRAEITETADAIQERLDPQRLKEQAKMRARDKLDYQRDNARRHERPRPQKVDVEPGALEYHHAKFLVNDDRYRAHHREHRQGVKPDCREVGKHCCRTDRVGMSGVGTLGMRPLHLLCGRKTQQHRDEHETRAVSSRHQKRPCRQVPEADPHPDPARVRALDELV